MVEGGGGMLNLHKLRDIHGVFLSKGQSSASAGLRRCFCCLPQVLWKKEKNNNNNWTWTCTKLFFIPKLLVCTDRKRPSLSDSLSHTCQIITVAGSGSRECEVAFFYDYFRSIFLFFFNTSSSVVIKGSTETERLPHFTSCYKEIDFSSTSGSIP